MKYLKIFMGILLAATLLLVSCGRRNPIEKLDESVESIDDSMNEEENSDNDTSTESVQGVVIPAEDPEASVYLIIPSMEGQSAVEAEQISQKVKAAGIPIIVKCYNRSIDKQTEAFEEAIKENASLIVCDNGDVDRTTIETEKAKAAHIPVILLNRGIDGMGIANTQIITDTYSCVMELGKEFIELMDGSCNYIEVQGSNSSFDITEAFADVMSGGSDMFMTRSDIAPETDAKASYDIIWDMINESPDADAVVCYNTMQTKAAMQAAGDLGRDMVFVCLYGDDDEIVELVNSGKVFASVIKPGDKIAELAASQVEKYIHTGEFPASELTYVKGSVIKNEDVKPRERTESSEDYSDSSQEESYSDSSEYYEDDAEEYGYVEVDEYVPAGDGLPE